MTAPQLVNRRLPRRTRGEPRADGSCFACIRPLAARERRMTAGGAALKTLFLAVGGLMVAVGTARRSALSREEGEARPHDRGTPQAR